MAKLSESTTPNSGGTNPNTTSTGGAINPSAPTAGTEGWGTTIDERQTLSPTDAAATRAGQMKGNLGDQQTEASSRMSAAATSANQPQTEREEVPPSNKQAAESTRGATALPNTNHGEADRTLRCADVGNADCQWETGGLTDDEVVLAAYEHGRAEHGWQDWTDAITKVREAIQYRNAA